MESIGAWFCDVAVKDLDFVRCRTFDLAVTRGECAWELDGAYGGDQSLKS